MKISARHKRDAQPLNEALVYSSLKKLFPKINDYSPSETGYSEELAELKKFGIMTTKDLRLLLKNHRKKILEIDATPLDGHEQKAYTEMYSQAVVNDNMKRRYFYAYPGLLRLAMQLEFGDKYDKFSNTRDGI